MNDVFGRRATDQPGAHLDESHPAGRATCTRLRACQRLTRERPFVPVSGFLLSLVDWNGSDRGLISMNTSVCFRTLSVSVKFYDDLREASQSWMNGSRCP